jgi:hypothetical protein
MERAAPVGPGDGDSRLFRRQHPGFPALPTAEDHALVEALTAGGSRVLRTRALPVVTSARRDSRAPDCFGHYLRKLAATPA